MLFIYGCGIRITIKKPEIPQFNITLPEIDSSWMNINADDFQAELAKIEQITNVVHAISANCDNLSTANAEQIKACNTSAKTGISLYLDMADKKQVIEFLEQSLNKKKLEIENEKRK
jgi:hypothetical protein